VNDEIKDRESYLGWQEIAITQLGYVINLFLTFAGVAVAFALKILMESRTPFPYIAHCFFYIALLLLPLSVAAALSANITRALDFRYSRRAARKRWKNETGHDEFEKKATRLGEWTWWLFALQTVAFGLGVMFLGLGLFLAYRSHV
jgi:hypothetical protein